MIIISFKFIKMSGKFHRLLYSYIYMHFQYIEYTIFNSALIKYTDAWQTEG